MSSSSKNVKLGVCNIFFDGSDLGLTKGGVEVEVSTSTHEVKVDQYGETPIGELITGRMVSATVPLAETTLDNLIRIMPGAALITDGVKATGGVTFSTAAPTSGNSVTILGQKFTFKTTPSNDNEMPIPSTVEEAAQILADTVNGSVIAVSASFSGAVVTLTANASSSDDNIALSSVGTNIATTGMTGGVTPTSARVDVSTGVNINLLDFARELKLRPIGTTGEDDFVIPQAACPGALNFTYNVDQERVFTANFKGYPSASGVLFSLGEQDAS